MNTQSTSIHADQHEIGSNDWFPLVDEPPPLDWDLEDLFASPAVGYGRPYPKRSTPPGPPTESDPDRESAKGGAIQWWNHATGIHPRSSAPIRMRPL